MTKKINILESLLVIKVGSSSGNCSVLTNGGIDLLLIESYGIGKKYLRFTAKNLWGIFSVDCRWTKVPRSYLGLEAISSNELLSQPSKNCNVDDQWVRRGVFHQKKCTGSM